MHELLSADEYWPAMHVSHTLAKVALNLPPGQVTHADSSASEYLPTGHSSHEHSALLLKLPASQVVHSSAAAPLCLPALQDRQAAVPTSEANLPHKHCSQPFEFGELNWPLAHSPHTVAPVEPNWPAAQMSQCSKPDSARYLPAAQEMQSVISCWSPDLPASQSLHVAPADSWYVPGAQVVQLELPAAA